MGAMALRLWPAGSSWRTGQTEQNPSARPQRSPLASGRELGRPEYRVPQINQASLAASAALPGSEYLGGPTVTPQSRPHDPTTSAAFSGFGALWQQTWPAWAGSLELQQQNIQYPGGRRALLRTNNGPVGIWCLWWYVSAHEVALQVAWGARAGPDLPANVTQKARPGLTQSQCTE